MGISFNNIIPTLFPFFILSDLWSATVQTKRTGLLGRGFEMLFNIDGRATNVFILGAVCGFPLGLKAAVKQYESGIITKEDLQVLCGFVNNPSIAFVISGVGAGIYRSFAIGILLYFSVILAACITGLIFRSKKKKITKSNHISRQSFSLVESIKSAGMSSITISSYIIFFSALISLIEKIPGNEFSLALISAFLEIASASNLIARLSNSLGAYSLILTAFALGFSGFSVHLQAFVFMPKELSKKKYLLMKFVQGVLSALIISLYLIPKK